MNTVRRTRSPRAPSISLDDAIEKVGKIYDKDRCHAAPIESVAQHLGYKTAANGAAASAFASLRYYGLLDRPKEGMAAVAKAYEEYQFAPKETIKRELITKWLLTPPVFAELLEKYAEGLPSDKTLVYGLIQKGFHPPAAESCVQVFRKSVDFARYFDVAEDTTADEVNSEDEIAIGATPEKTPGPAFETAPMAAVRGTTLTAPIAATTPITPAAAVCGNVDRIPIRLAGGRRAWMEIPTPFYEADKDRLKNQIDLLITDDEEDVDDLA